jgi:hypothetical protein
MTDPRQSPRKNDPNFGQQVADGEKAELEEQEDRKEDEDPDLGQKEADQEKAELDEEEGEKDNELEPMTRTMAAAWLSF